MRLLPGALVYFFMIESLPGQTPRPKLIQLATVHSTFSEKFCNLHVAETNQEAWLDILCSTVAILQLS